LTNPLKSTTDCHSRVSPTTTLSKGKTTSSSVDSGKSKSAYTKDDKNIKIPQKKEKQIYCTNLTITTNKRIKNERTKLHN